MNNQQSPAEIAAAALAQHGTIAKIKERTQAKKYAHAALLIEHNIMSAISHEVACMALGLSEAEIGWRATGHEFYARYKNLRLLIEAVLAGSSGTSRDPQENPKDYDEAQLLKGLLLGKLCDGRVSSLLAEEVGGHYADPGVEALSMFCEMVFDRNPVGSAFNSVFK